MSEFILRTNLRNAVRTALLTQERLERDVYKYTQDSSYLIDLRRLDKQLSSHNITQLKIV